jgi:hypothetical protein
MRKGVLNMVKRYTSALNEMVNYNQIKPITGIVTYAQIYGISREFFSFLVHNRTLLKTGDRARSTFSFTPDKIKEGSFTEAETNSLILAWERFKKSKGKDEGPVHDLSDNSKFAGVETKELFAELKRRGYSGILEIITKKVIKL